MHQRHGDGDLRFVPCPQVDRALHRFDIRLAAVGITAGVLLHHTDTENRSSLFFGDGGSDAEENAVAERDVSNGHAGFDALHRDGDVPVRQGRRPDGGKKPKVDLVGLHGAETAGDGTKAGELFMLRALIVIEMNRHDLIPLRFEHVGRQRRIHAAAHDTDRSFCHCCSFSGIIACSPLALAQP